MKITNILLVLAVFFIGLSWVGPFFFDSSEIDDELGNENNIILVSIPYFLSIISIVMLMSSLLLIAYKDHLLKKKDRYNSSMILKRINRVLMFCLFVGVIVTSLALMIRIIRMATMQDIKISSLFCFKIINSFGGFLLFISLYFLTKPTISYMEKSNNEK